MKTFLISRETENVNYYFSVFRIFIKITLKKASIFQMVYDLYSTFLSAALHRPSHHKCQGHIPPLQTRARIYKHKLHVCLF